MYKIKTKRKPFFPGALLFPSSKVYCRSGYANLLRDLKFIKVGMTAEMKDG